MASKLAEAFAPEYQSSGPEWLRLIGAVANRMRGGGLAPDATTVAGFLPGAGLVQGHQDANKARRSFGEGNYGQAAIDMGNSMLNTASELPGVGGLAKLAMAAAPAAKGVMKAFAKADDVAAVKPPGIRAFHGSPHDFDRFSMDKIGTGEGAQAYGHGLYFAENEGVAKGYRKSVSAMQDVPKSVNFEGKNVWQGHELNELTPAQIAAHAVAEMGGVDPALDQMRAFAQSPYTGDMWRNAAAEVEANPARFKDVKWAEPGKMYEVNIAADPEHFLDWDKPLSEQSEHVRRSLGWTPEAETAYKQAQGADTDSLLAALEGNATYSATRPPVPQGLPSLDATGADIAKGNSIFDRGSDAVKAQGLRDKGIPGIKYLDAGSRTAGDGSRNYVAFDDSIISIVKKYGWAPGMAIPAAMALELQNAQGGNAPQL